MCQLAAFQTGNGKWMGGKINELRIISISFIYCSIIEYIRLSDCPEIVERLMNVARQTSREISSEVINQLRKALFQSVVPSTQYLVPILVPTPYSSLLSHRPMQHILINMQPHTKIYQKEVNCISGILYIDLT